MYVFFNLDIMNAYLDQIFLEYSYNRNFCFALFIFFLINLSSLLRGKKKNRGIKRKQSERISASSKYEVTVKDKLSSLWKLRGESLESRK